MADRILITGGTGFVGQQIFHHLRRNPQGRFPIRFSPDDYRLTDREETRALFKAAEPNVVVHLATPCLGETELAAGPATFWRGVLESIKNILDVSAEFKARRVIVVASVCMPPCVGSVACDEAFFEQRTRGLPPMDFASAKKCHAWAKLRGLEFCMIITPQVFGPGDNFDLKGGHRIAIVMRLIQEALAAGRKQVVLPVQADEAFEAVYVDELVRGVSAAVKTEKAPGPVVMQGFKLTWATLAEMMAAAAGFKGDFVWAPLPPDPRARPWSPPPYPRVAWKPALAAFECVKKSHAWYLTSKYAVQPR
jgi:GDP-L-fucose synthase